MGSDLSGRRSRCCQQIGPGSCAEQAVDDSLHPVEIDHAFEFLALLLGGMRPKALPTESQNELAQCHKPGFIPEDIQKGRRTLAPARRIKARVLHGVASKSVQDVAVSRRRRMRASRSRYLMRIKSERCLRVGGLPNRSAP